jgi:DNA-directed RNA polymerase specialized sigma24 family protein
MSILTNLAKEYKVKKDNRVLEQILKIIKRDIEKRVELIYRKLEHYQIDKKDIKQELYIKILSILHNYDIREPFENYLFSSLKYWKPKLTKDDTISFESLYKSDENSGEELEIDIEDKRQTNTDSNIILEEIYKECKNEIERKILNCLLENPGLSHYDLEKELKIPRRTITSIINRLREKLKKFRPKSTF